MNIVNYLLAGVEVLKFVIVYGRYDIRGLWLMINFLEEESELSDSI